MYKYLVLMSLLCLVPDLSAQEKSFETFEMPSGDTTFIMKKYFLCMYKSGENRSGSDEERMEIQKEHLAHISNLAEKGLVHIAGPLESTDDNRGILIFNVYSKEEAEEWTRQDPAVKAGRLGFVIYPLWAAKGSTLR